MTDAQKAALQSTLIAGAIVFALYKFAPNQAVKAMALGVGGVIAAKKLPYLSAAV